jgi:hypothetical protein
MLPPIAPIRFLPALVLFVAWLLQDRALAQPLGSTVVVPFAVGDSAVPLDEARALELALQERRVQVLSLHEAQDRFLSHSRPPRSPSRTDLDALAREAQAAIEHVAFGRTAAAERSVRQIVELSERSLEMLNRETATARSLLDACLALVRAALHDGKRDEALEQAMRCRRLVPDLAPSDVSHPANVVGALAEADDQLRRMRVGRLNVQARPERNCEVFLNGRHLGHTPFALDRAPTGDYRVQVECDSATPARVHAIHLGDEPVELTIHADLDAAIEAGPRLALRYRDEIQARASLVRHATLLGRETRTNDVVLVGVLARKLISLRVQVSQERLVAGATHGNERGAAHAADALTQTRFAALDPQQFRAQPSVAQTMSGAALKPPPSAAKAAALAPRSSASDPEGSGPEPRGRPLEQQATSRPLVITGSILTALGGAGLGAGYGLLFHARALRSDAEAGDPGSPEQARHQTKYDDFRLVPLAGIAGAVLAAAGIPMLLPKHAPRSAAAWAGGALAGAAGIAAIAFGAARTPSDPALGGLLLATGAPLLSIPITQFARASW